MDGPALAEIVERATPPYNAGTAWARALADFLAAQPPRGEAAPGTTPAERTHGSGARAAYAAMDAVLAPSPVAVTPEARAALAAQLGARLTMTCAAALDAELRAVPETTLDVSAEGWRERFERLPGLAHLVGLLYAQWREGTEELFRRLAADRDELAESLWDGVAPTALTGFRGDAGDPHNGGRSVALLAFDGDCRAVYKATDLRSAAAFMALVEAVSDDLRTFTVVVRDGYGWEEELAPGPSSSRAEVAAYYRRFGELLRLLQLLEARDFWLDNLLACGGQPVFVDFETLVQPRHAPPAAPCASALLEESVVPTGAVSLRVRGAGGVAVPDLGALAPSRPITTPFELTLEAFFPASERPAADDRGHIVMPPPPYAPVLDGAAVGVEAFTGELVAGFEAMHASLVARRDAVERALAAFEGLPARAILRDTFTCHRILQAAAVPRLLVDGAARDRALRRILRTTTEDVGWAEIESFRRLDVPLFSSRTDSADLETPTGMVAEGFFAGTPWDRLRARVAGLGDFPLERHVELLMASLAAGDRTTRAPRLRADDGEPPLDRAVRLADEILAAAITEDDGSLSWVGLTYDPFDGGTRVEVLRPDLLTGTCGIAVLLADLHAVTGEERFAHGARGAIAAARAFAREAPAQLADAHPAWVLPCGEQLGVGSALFAMARCGLAAEAATAAAALPFELLGERSPGDHLCGVAGLARAIERGGIALGTPERERLDSAVRAAAGRPAPYAPGAAMPGDADPEVEPPPWDLSVLWGKAGVAHALLRRHDPGVSPVRAPA